MTTRQRYAAYWIPGLNDDEVDADDAIELAFRWLRTVGCEGARLVVMNTAGMIGNRRSLRAAAGFRVVSPQTRNAELSRRRNAVLAIWPTTRTLDLAEGLALDGSLCVIPGTIDDVRPWMLRTSAKNLWAPHGELEPMPELAEEVRRVLDSIISFDGHNDFIGAGGKETSIARLRALVRDGYRPDAQDLENYVLASGGTRSHKGAQRLREWYQGILDGRRFRDRGGRPI
jgi:hypothetical protein